MSFLFYRRPNYTQPSAYSITSTECARVIERTAGSVARSIPPELSLDVVLENRAIPPCSLSDFMDYLLYIERGAENLQFYLWYREYCRKWDQLTEAQRALSPYWQNSGKPMEPEMIETHVPPMRRQSSLLANMIQSVTQREKSRESLDGKEGRDITQAQVEKFLPSLDEQGRPVSQWQMSSHQPLRDECNQAIRHYLAFGAPRELNLSHRDRAACLQALTRTTHPSAFATAVAVCRATLQAQSHPNFIRWSICNGNKPRVVAVRYAASAGIMLGYTIAILLTLSHSSRWWRLFALIGWFPGITSLIAAYKGLCIIMYFGGNGTRNLRPWEQSVHEEDACGRELHIYLKPSIVVQPTRNVPSGDYSATSSVLRREKLLKPFGGGNKDWETSSWAGAYEKKSLLGKVFEKETWIENEHLKFLQQKIIWGAIVWAIVATVALAVLFVAVPAGNFY